MVLKSKKSKLDSQVNIRISTSDKQLCKEKGVPISEVFRKGLAGLKSTKLIEVKK